MPAATHLLGDRERSSSSRGDFFGGELGSRHRPWPRHGIRVLRLRSRNARPSPLPSRVMPRFACTCMLHPALVRGFIPVFMTGWAVHLLSKPPQGGIHPPHANGDGDRPRTPSRTHKAARRTGGRLHGVARFWPVTCRRRQGFRGGFAPVASRGEMASSRPSGKSHGPSPAGCGLSRRRGAGARDQARACDPTGQGRAESNGGTMMKGLPDLSWWTLGAAMVLRSVAPGDDSPSPDFRGNGPCRPSTPGSRQGLGAPPAGPGRRLATTEGSRSRPWHGGRHRPPLACLKASHAGTRGDRAQPCRAQPQGGAAASVVSHKSLVLGCSKNAPGQGVRTEHTRSGL